MSIDDLKKVMKRNTELSKEHTRLMGNASITPDMEDIEKLKKDFADLESKFKDIKFVDLITYDADRIISSATNLKRGRVDNPYVDDIKDYVNKLQETIDLYKEASSEMRSLSESVAGIDDDLETEAEYKKTHKSASIISTLDRIASTLESRGFLKEASDIDIISNTIEANVLADGFNNLKSIFSKSSTAGAFNDAKKRIIAKLGSKRGIANIVKSIKSPEDFIRQVGEKLGWDVSPAQVSKAIANIQNATKDTSSPATVEAADLSDQIAAGDELLVETLTVLMSSLAGIALEAVDATGINKLLSFFKNRYNVQDEEGQGL